MDVTERAATALPIVTLEGSPYEQGLTHGKQTREQIVHNLTVYFHRLERETKLPKAEVLRRAGLYLRVIEKAAPKYAETMRGIAEGSESELLEITTLNARYELIYSEVTQQALRKPDGCTSFALLPNKTTNEHLLIGENWDWMPGVHGVVLKIREPDAPEIICFTEAGIVGGKIGLNSAGIGLAINGLNSEKDDWSYLHKPFHIRCWEVLHCTDFEQAVCVVTEGERSVSANFLIAQPPDNVMDLETAPTGINELCARDGWVAHTNHFMNPAAIGLTREIQPSKRPSTHQRLARAQQLLRANATLDIEKIKEILRDHHDYPYSLCRHPDETFPPEERYQSVVSVVMDVNARTFAIASGPPCQHEYQTLSL